MTLGGEAAHAKQLCMQCGVGLRHLIVFLHPALMYCHVLSLCLLQRCIQTNMIRQAILTSQSTLNFIPMKHPLQPGVCAKECGTQ